MSTLPGNNTDSTAPLQQQTNDQELPTQPQVQADGTRANEHSQHWKRPNDAAVRRLNRRKHCEYRFLASQKEVGRREKERRWWSVELESSTLSQHNI